MSTRNQAERQLPLDIKDIEMIKQWLDITGNYIKRYNKYAVNEISHRC